MKKLYLLLVFFFFSSFSAQMDTEHWFAPMKRQANNNRRMMGLYLSTNQTTPFYVKIENNKKIIDSVKISKNNPIRYEILDMGLMEAVTTDSLQQAISKGLHVYGERKFFANLRFSQSNHAEIITSKGRAALGTHFFVAYAPFSRMDNVMNFSIGVIATEDNTTVALNGTSFTLNRGKSYLFEGFDTTFIGKEIISDKPVAVTNGNYNGQYASTSDYSGTDILMDQTVPIERLGREFILMSGNGNFTDGMESAIIVATADDTKVFFNDETTPTATLNKGQYFLMPTQKYQQKNTTTSTAYIKTSENVYVFQLLSGSGSLAAGGFNYIPPLNCYLPKSINEIGFVNENPGYLYTNNNYIYHSTHNTKLNIISQTGATVKLNGNILNGIYGPHTITGTVDWATYTVPYVTGTIVIESSRAVTAGIAAGDDAVGYGGYFAGASSIPVITKSGACLPGISLEVEDTFDNYQWKIKNPTTGNFEDIAGATSFKYTPAIPGEYICEIGTENCGKLITPSYLVLNCTVNSAKNYTICQQITFTPVLSKSSQDVNPAKIRFISNPLKGEATISNGQITYTPNNSFADNTTDSFSYYIEGNALYPDSEIVTVTITLKKLTAQNAELFGCLTNGVTVYDLTKANLTSDTNVSIHYYETLADASANNIASELVNPGAYSTSLTKVYATVTSEFGCSKTVEISLKNYPVPNIDIKKINSTYCDDDLDGKITIRFSDVTPVIVNNPQDFDVIYTLKGSGTVLPNDFSFTSDTAVNVEVKSKNGCPSVTGTLDFIVGKPVSIVGAVNTDVCDNSLSGSANINLSDYSALFTVNATATFYSTETDAKLKRNPITSNQTISGDAQFYYRFENTSDCPAVGVLNTHFKQPKKSELLTNTEICSSTTINLSVEDGFSSYLWSNGSTTKDSGQLPVGSYWVDLGYNGCVYRQTVTVSAAPEPVIKEIKVTGKNAEVFVTDGSAPYTYALDNGDWQSSPSFNSILTGRHKISVKDSKGCTVVEKEFLILNLINAITPNGDGINDKLDYSDLVLKKNVLLEVYDRYGKQLYHSKDRYVWDGTVSGRTVSTGTYWYILKWTEENGENMQYAGWILVKNQ